MDINGIAELAGVSRATVSRYLNDGYVSQEKRERIRRVIEETGYVPSQSAQQLRTGKTNLVGVITPKIHSQSVARMIEGITAGLADTEYHMLLAVTNYDLEEEVRCLRMFSERPRVDGIILISAAITKDHLAAIDALSAPVVSLGQRTDACSCVSNDDYRSVYDLTQIVLRNAKHPAFIGVSNDYQAAGAVRHNGFMDACREAGIEVPEDAQEVGDFSVESGFFCCEHILHIQPETDAIVCANDNMAYGAITCLREYGRRVPEDVQVTGFGDSELSRILTPSLTTAHLAFRTGGVESAKMLLEAMGGKNVGRREIELDYQIFGRNSTLWS